MTNFWQAVAEHNWEQPEQKLEFRLYYNEEGHVLYYSMEDLPGNYISVDRLTFDQARFDLRVKDGKLVKLRNPASWKLVPSDSGTPCHKDNICVVVNDDFEKKTYWKVTTTHEAD